MSASASTPAAEEKQELAPVVQCKGVNDLDKVVLREVRGSSAEVLRCIHPLSPALPISPRHMLSVPPARSRRRSMALDVTMQSRPQLLRQSRSRYSAELVGSTLPADFSYARSGWLRRGSSGAPVRVTGCTRLLFSSRSESALCISILSSHKQLQNNGDTKFHNTGRSGYCDRSWCFCNP